MRSKTSLDLAVRAVWDDLTDEEADLLRKRLTDQLTAGAFHYVIVAQQFAPSVQRTIEYLNAASKAARFYAVELVGFASATLSAFEARTILKPTISKRTDTSGPNLDQERLLQLVEGEDYRQALQELLEACQGLGLTLYFGSSGMSIRVKTQDKPQPVSIAWLFPNGVSGWMGLRDLNLGFDQVSTASTPSIAGALARYLKSVGGLQGAQLVGVKGMQVYHLSPEAVVQNRVRLTEILAKLAQEASGAA